MKGMIQSIMSS